MPKLTERRQLETRGDIANAAVALFLSDGYEATTMDDVAEAAGVSRRTVYRYFPTKDDLVFEYPSRWLEQFKDEIARRDPAESLRDFSRRVILSLAASITEEREPILAAYSVLGTTDALRGAHGKADDLWVQQQIQMLTSDPKCTPDLFSKAAVVAAATNAGTNVAIAMWAMSGGETDLVDTATTILDQLDPIWPDEFR